MKKLTKKEREAVKHKYGGFCAYCGVSLDGIKWHVDHFEPVLRGHRTIFNEDRTEVIGQSPYINGGEDDLNNMMPACASCNLSKSTFDIEKWREVISNYIKVIERNTPTYRISKRFDQVVETDKPVVFFYEKFDSEEH